MIILRDNFFSDRSNAERLKDTFNGAIKGAIEAWLGRKGNIGSNEKKDGEILGILVIDRFCDKSRFIGKDCKFRVKNDLSVEGVWNKNSNIYWDLDEEFKPCDNCPTDFKEFTIEGKPQDGGYLDAKILIKRGTIIFGKVLVEVK